ncbi:hypothetical protein GCM10023116_30520 [Kistimonas scapharcae]|uniref:Uncharacterized protein n=1 Tax=Kistimonas scapharcae TaxID=1036133 RepID=A0ABP8V439_9GAMM
MEKPGPSMMLGSLLTIFFFLLVVPVALARQKEGNLGPISSGSFAIILSIMPTIRHFQPIIEDVVGQETTCFSSYGLPVIAKTESDYCPHANFTVERDGEVCITTNHSDVEHLDSIIIEPI